MVILRMLSLVVGLVAVYAALFMVEDGQGRWRSRLERLWIEVRDRDSQVGSRPLALFGKVAELLDAAFDRIFGPRLVAGAMMGASVSISWAIVLTLLAFGSTPADGMALEGSHESTRDALFAAAAACWAAALLPIVFRARWLVAISLVPLLAVLLYSVVDITMPGQGDDRDAPATLAVSMPLGVASDLLVTVLVRRLVRYVAAGATGRESSSPSRSTSSAASR